MRRSITVRVPATSANCGAGFDVLGVSCALYSEITLTLTDETDEVTFDMTGEGANLIPTDKKNIVWKSVQFLLQRVNMAEKFTGGTIRMKNAVPLSKGLGSSAAAIVGGLKAANVIVGNYFNRSELLDLATEIEGHPDNVAPAVFGGFTVSTTENEKVNCFTFLPKIKLKLVAAVPDFPLPTREAREVLPQEVPRSAAVFNIGRAAMLVASLISGNERFIGDCFADMLHQPYREQLIPGMKDVIHAATEAGAYGAALSGAGPTMMAFAPLQGQNAVKVGDAMVEAFAQNGVKARAMILNMDTRGAHIVNY